MTIINNSMRMIIMTNAIDARADDAYHDGDNASSEPQHTHT